MRGSHTGAPASLVKGWNDKMARIKIRSLRHWKQRFDKNAEFIWRRPVKWQGELAAAGDPIPETLSDNKAKLRRFWEAKVIELAVFEEPDVVSGQKLEPTPELKNDETLIGSDLHPNEIDVNGEMVPLGEVVVLAFENSELTMAEWNTLEGVGREFHIETVIEGMRDFGQEPEPTPEPSVEVKPEDLVTKETDRKWLVEGIDEVFKSKTLATAAAVEMIAKAKAAAKSGDDDWLGEDTLGG